MRIKPIEKLEELYGELDHELKNELHLLFEKYDVKLRNISSTTPIEELQDTLSKIRYTAERDASNFEKDVFKQGLKPAIENFCLRNHMLNPFSVFDYSYVLLELDSEASSKKKSSRVSSSSKKSTSTNRRR